MNKLMKKIEDIMVAVTFAEAGEYDEASRYAGSELDRVESNQLLENLHKAAMETTGK